MCHEHLQLCMLLDLTAGIGVNPTGGLGSECDKTVEDVAVASMHD